MKINKWFFLFIPLCAALCLSACGEEKAEKKLTQEEQRMVGYSYDFINYVSVDMKGANTLGEISNIKIKIPRLKSFKNEEDYIQIKELLDKSEVVADKKSDLKNGDKVTFTLESQGEVSEKVKKIINVTPYTYTVQNLKKGTSIDLIKDVSLNLMAFETTLEGKINVRKNEDYKMQIKPIVSEKGNQDLRHTIFTRVEVDDSVVTYEQSIATIKIGLPKTYLIDHELTIKKHKGYPVVCEVWNNDDKIICGITLKQVLKEEQLAKSPNQEPLKGKIESKDILAYLNAHKNSFSTTDLNTNEVDSNTNIESFQDMIGLYKVNSKLKEAESDNPYGKYRYAACVKVIDEKNNRKYALIGFGLMQNEDENGFFSYSGDDRLDFLRLGPTMTSVTTSNESYELIPFLQFY